MPITTDFTLYCEAVHALFSGQNPYLLGEAGFRFFNPIWTLLLMAPFAALGSTFGKLALDAASIAAFTLVARRLRLNLYQTLLLCTSGFAISNLVNGNIEWMPWLGLFLPAPLAIAFFLIKPQTTIGVIVLTLLNEWKHHGLAAWASSLRCSGCHR